MPFIPYQEYDQADQGTKELWDKQVNDHGRMTNMKRTLAHSYLSLRSFMEWYPMKDEVVSFLGERATIIFVHAISSEADCLICSTYFRRNLIDWGENPDELELSETEQLLVDFARAIIKDSNNVPQPILEKLKSQFTDAQVVLLIAFAGIMIATNVFNNVLDIPLDDYLETYKKSSNGK